MNISVSIPQRLFERLQKEGLDAEQVVVEMLLERLGLDPSEAAETHLELAERFLREGVELADRDPVQASEKLYKAAEECIKAAALHMGFRDILERVRGRGRWVVEDLERAARRAGEDIYIGWDRASYLHIWGFHEARLDSEAVKARIPYIEKMITRLRESLGRSA